MTKAITITNQQCMTSRCYSLASKVVGENIVSEINSLIDKKHGRSKSYLVVLIIAVFACSYSYGQENTYAARNNIAQLKPVSKSHLYYHFLMFQKYLDSKALQMEEQGKDGSNVRNVLRRQLGFSEEIFAPLRQASVRMKEKDETIKRKIEQLKNDGIADSVQIKSMRDEKQKAIDLEVENIHAEMPPDKIKELDVFLQKFFAPKIVQVQAPEGKNPNKGNGQ